MKQSTLSFSKPSVVPKRPPSAPSSALAIVPDAVENSPSTRVQRLVVASFKAASTAVEALEASGFRVHVYSLNSSTPDCGVAEVQQCLEYHGSVPGAHFSLRDETADYDIGADQACGVVSYACEIADVLVHRKRHAVVVTSEKGGAVAKLVATLAMCVAKSMCGKKASKLVGGTSGMSLKAGSPTKKFADLVASKVGSFGQTEPCSLALKLYHQLA